MTTGLRRIALAVSAVALVLAVPIGSAPSARADNGDFCNSRGLCLNDWNNDQTGPVKGAQEGITNEYFVWQPVTRCGNGQVSAAKECPFNDSHFNQEYNGSTIGQIFYDPSGGLQCVGVGDQQGDTVLVGCNNVSNGMGGGIGTIFIDHDGYLIDLFMTNVSGDGTNARCLTDTGLDRAINAGLPTNQGCPWWAGPGF